MVVERAARRAHGHRHGSGRACDRLRGGLEPGSVTPSGLPRIRQVGCLHSISWPRRNATTTRATRHLTTRPPPSQRFRATRTAVPYRARPQRHSSTRRSSCLASSSRPTPCRRLRTATTRLRRSRRRPTRPQDQHVAAARRRPRTANGHRPRSSAATRCSPVPIRSSGATTSDRPTTSRRRHRSQANPVAPPVATPPRSVEHREPAARAATSTAPRPGASAASANRRATDPVGCASRDRLREQWVA